MKVLYLGTNLLSKGGIPRYSRYQVRALRETWGTEAVDAFCLHPQGEDDFEEPFELDFGGTEGEVPHIDLLHSVDTLFVCAPRLVERTHVNLSGIPDTGILQRELASLGERERRLLQEGLKVPSGRIRNLTVGQTRSRRDHYRVAVDTRQWTGLGA